MALIVGLTGGIATGKTTVASMFEEHAVPVIDTDRLAREAVEPGRPALEKLIDQFGAGIVDEAGILDRDALARKVFYDRHARRKVERIVHPYVKEAALEQSRALRDQGEKLIVWDVPLLFETDFHTLVDLTVLVFARRKDQISRLKARDDIDEAFAIRKIKAQLPLSKKRELADFVIDNSKSLKETRKDFQRVFSAISQRTRPMRRMPDGEG